MSVRARDTGEVLDIQFGQGWVRSSFPEPLITVDHGAPSPRELEGDVIGIVLAGPARAAVVQAIMSNAIDGGPGTHVDEPEDADDIGDGYTKSREA